MRIRDAPDKSLYKQVLDVFLWSLADKVVWSEAMLRWLRANSIDLHNKEKL